VGEPEHVTVGEARRRSAFDEDVLAQQRVEWVEIDRGGQQRGPLDRESPVVHHRAADRLQQPLARVGLLDWREHTLAPVGPKQPDLGIDVRERDAGREQFGKQAQVERDAREVAQRLRCGGDDRVEVRRCGCQLSDLVLGQAPDTQVLDAEELLLAPYLGHRRVGGCGEEAPQVTVVAQVERPDRRNHPPARRIAQDIADRADERGALETAGSVEAVYDENARLGRPRREHLGKRPVDPQLARQRGLRGRLEVLDA